MNLIGAKPYSTPVRPWEVPADTCFASLSDREFCTRIVALPVFPGITGTRNRWVVSLGHRPDGAFDGLTVGATGEYPVIVTEVSPAAKLTVTRAAPWSVNPVTRFLPIVTNWSVSPRMAIPEGPTGASTRYSASPEICF